jgi:dTDP-4-dehydrorhamnose 3,5-epimerase
VFGDQRGYFVETYSRRAYEEVGISSEFVQDNVSFSTRGVLRGLHLQRPHAQGKLVQAVRGTLFDVAVDLRVDSPTFKQWVGVELSEDNHKQLYIPPGFAHGFCVLSEVALCVYKCSDYYEPASEFGVHYADPELGIAWPVAEPTVSDKDRQLPLLAEVPKARLLGS